MFGDRFDFNGDGKNDVEDLFIEMDLAIDDDDVDIEEEIEVEEDEPEEVAKNKTGWSKVMASKNSVSALHEKLEQCKDIVESKMEALQGIYDERSLNEPDFLSSRYDAWQDKQSEYEERIESLEDIVSKLEDVIDQLDDLVSECSDILSDCELYAADHKDLNGILPTLRLLLG